MIGNRLFASLITFLGFAGLQAQEVLQVPRLVVTITVDQLRGDYLHYFSPSMGDRGFKRLLNGGTVYNHLKFGFPNRSRAAAAATLSTGSFPFTHGIVADKRFDFESAREQSILFDSAFIGNYTSDHLSPSSVLVSTVGDQLKLASGGHSDVYAIAPEATSAIVSAGKYANAAFWLDNSSGKWATTTYYKQVPWFVERFNTIEALGNRSEVYWMPALSEYKAFPYTKNALPFKYEFTKSDPFRFEKLKQTPLINADITRLASSFLEYADFGKRTNPDMLAITYYAGNYLGTQSDEYSTEIQDIYYRLDKEMETLLDLIDQRVGLNNTLVVLASTGYFDYQTELLAGFKPSGEFFPNRCVALLNMYLMALHGQSNWVLGYYDQQIYLNKKLVTDQKIDWATFLQQASEFVMQFSGVKNVTNAREILFEDYVTDRNEFRRAMHPKINGDIYIQLQSGWTIANENNSNKTNKLSQSALITPLIFFGNNIPSQQIERPIKAVDVAPTISHILRIRPPNASDEAPLQEFLFRQRSKN